jgi:predicted dinucleotide-binding enzyme
VAKVCTDFGWKVIDIGGIEGSRYLESLTMIWNHAFKLLRR